MMNIYELFAVATEGQLHLDTTGYPVHIYAEGIQLVANCHGRDHIEAEHNAQLLAHCRNNFLRALEALKEEHEERMFGIYDEDGELVRKHDKEGCPTCQLIKELEEVK